MRRSQQLIILTAALVTLLLFIPLKERILIVSSDQSLFSIDRSNLRFDIHFDRILMNLEYFPVFLSPELMPAYDGNAYGGYAPDFFTKIYVLPGTTANFDALQSEVSVDYSYPSFFPIRTIIITASLLLLLLYFWKRGEHRLFINCLLISISIVMLLNLVYLYGLFFMLSLIGIFLICIIPGSIFFYGSRDWLPLGIGLSLSLISLLSVWLPFLGLGFSIIHLCVLMIPVAYHYRNRLRKISFRPELSHAPLIFAVLVSMYVPLLSVKPVIAPINYDQTTHSLLIKLFVEQGTRPASWRPYLFSDNLAYPSSFHATAYLFQQLTGYANIPKLGVIVAALLYALLPFLIYALTNNLFDRRIALISALLSSFPVSLMAQGHLKSLMANLTGYVLLVSSLLLFLHMLKGRRFHPAIIGIFLSGMFAWYQHTAVIAFFALSIVLILNPQTRKTLLHSLLFAAILSAPYLLTILNSSAFTQETLGRSENIYSIFDIERNSIAAKLLLTYFSILAGSLMLWKREKSRETQFISLLVLLTLGFAALASLLAFTYHVYPMKFSYGLGIIALPIFLSIPIARIQPESLVWYLLFIPLLLFSYSFYLPQFSEETTMTVQDYHAFRYLDSGGPVVIDATSSPGAYARRCISPSDAGTWIPFYTNHTTWGYFCTNTMTPDERPITELYFSFLDDPENKTIIADLKSYNVSAVYIGRVNDGTPYLKKIDFPNESFTEVYSHGDIRVYKFV